MAADDRKPEDDPAEGSRDVVEQNLKDQKQRVEEQDPKRPFSHPLREDKEMGPKGAP